MDVQCVKKHKIKLLPTREVINLSNQVKVKISDSEYRLLKVIPCDGLDRESIIKHVWGGKGRVVTNSSYYNLIHKLKKTLLLVGINDAVHVIPNYGLVISCDVELGLNIELPWDFNA